MLPLLLGELEEDTLAFGFVEALAVLLEESVRTSLAADADEQCLLIVDAVAQPIREARADEAVVGGAEFGDEAVDRRVLD